MGSYHFPPGMDPVGPDISFVASDTNFFIDAGESAQFLDITVRRLITIVRQGLVVLERRGLVCLQANRTGLSPPKKKSGFKVVISLDF